MVQIARRKKGRPSKADLARRSGESPAAASQPDLRRSHRRRSVRYNIIDYDGDYLDDEEDERRREKKKLKLMAKLNQDGEEEPEEENDMTPSRTGADAPADEYEDDENEQEKEHEHEQEEEHVEDEDGVVKGRKVESKGLHSISVSGTPVILQSGIPLPDKRTLELILDKLQKKDTYGVFAEPVDPEELPDYHDVIDHPMDFATVRQKLAAGSYTTLEQFESDIFLICSNAMQYNAAETIYHKQARSIQELGRKKFEKLRIGFERSQMEHKSEQKAGSNYFVKKQPKKPLVRTSLEPVGSDFSSGATLATIADLQPTSHPMQGGRCERPGNIDGILEANAFWIDANQEKAEDVLSGKGLHSKWGRKSVVLDESRRASYNMFNQPIGRSESIFMTFDSEMKQLVAVGLHAEYSYARSLARFSASLGPIAWKIASHRIQQALPPGFKYGRGWVGEYEQLPTPILMVNNQVQKGTSLAMKLHSTIELPKGDKSCKNVEPSIEHPVSGQMLDGKHPLMPDGEGKPFFGSSGERICAPANIRNQEQNNQSRKMGKPENKGLKQEELNSLSSSKQNNNGLVAKFTSNTPAAESKPREMVPRNKFKQPGVSGELPNGKSTDTSLNRQVTGPSLETTSSNSSREGPVVHGKELGVSDPVQLMGMFAERAQKQHNLNHFVVDTPPVTLSGPSGQRDDLGNASAAAARAWMSVGAGGFKQGPDNSSSPKNQTSADSLYNSTREFHQHISRIRGDFPSAGMPFQPFQAPVPQSSHTGTVSQFPNRPTVFPHLASADQSRFQMQSPWRGLSPRSQSRQKQETFPPDLNIGFQSPGSPAKQSSGVLVDSQQPDLALQL
ncbi:hypothetical protein LR48_Vigan583s001600 [Vigna angularis]|uniref:Transcription factor GTE10 Bromodomain-containing protein n=2 Tax=Phaseolus angularis TaxID=3914 RepID=A0A0L9TDS0_PHAAN|nr:uncharacterized protein LOC108321942 [Vigna angularis]KAG2394672.1 Transcription factor GTE10 Bromodomain-containing protein [Vigna angularis]KOM28765.1 hypothetical protein LR48_Vigan583s001600 [Vigna angularis]BAT88623.1 hypothetical protein VIGAN_05216300 [Vigna angularis var. angularis]